MRVSQQLEPPVEHRQPPLAEHGWSAPPLHTPWEGGGFEERGQLEPIGGEVEHLIAAGEGESQIQGGRDEKG